MGKLLGKILVLSNRSKSNYYLILLENALLNEGIRVTFIKKLHFWFPILRIILKSKFKIIHIHWLYEIAGFYYRNKLKSFPKIFIFLIDVILVKFFFKKKIIWTVHNLYSHESYFHNMEKLVRIFFSRLVDIIIAHCDIAKKKIVNNYKANPRKIFVVPLGNYNNIYKNTISKEKAREFLKLGKRDFIFLCFGPIRPYKGVDLIINAFNALQQVEKIKLMIIGRVFNKKIKKQIVDLSKENSNIIVKFKYIPDDEVQYYLNASDIVVFSYRKILSSAGIFLAMSFSKAIIAPQLGCLVNILDKKGSFLYNPGQQNGLLFALNKAIDNKAKVAEMGHYNLNLSKKFDWRDVGTKTRDIYFNILKK